MRDFFSLHPATRILIWIALAVYSFTAPPPELALLSLILAGALILLRQTLFFRLLRRVRWILISLIVIYGFETPGQALFSYGPAWEGIASGALQAWRIVLTIALLAVLQGSTSREMMLSGLYSLLSPFQSWINAERIAVRLLLTLHYAEEKATGDWRERLDAVFVEQNAPPMLMALPVYSFEMRDWAVFIMLAAALML